MRFRFIVPLLILAVLLAAGPSGSLVEAQGTEKPCRDLVLRAFSELGTNCANLGPNSVCYGFPGVQSTFATGTGLQNPGDRADLTQLTDIKTASFNLTDSTWGVSVMHVQANVPGGLADQTALYMLMGDVEVINEVAPEDALLTQNTVSVTTTASTDVRSEPGAEAQALGSVAQGTAFQADGVSPDGAWVRVAYQDQAAWISMAAFDASADFSSLPTITRSSLTPMQSFQFRTGPTSGQCPTVMPSVLMVQSPRNTPIDIKANGVDIRVGSVVFLRTDLDGRMEVLTSDGKATLYPDTERALDIQAGTSVKVPVGPAHTWTAWQILSQTDWDTFAPVEAIPPNVGPYPVPHPPIITKPSGIGNPPPVVQTSTQEFTPVTPVPNTYPIIEMVTGEIGQELESAAWEPISIGGKTCPDWVLFHSNRDGDWDIYRLSDTNVSQGPASDDIQPTYSIDSEWVAFTSTRDFVGDWEIYLANSDGSEQVRVTYNSAKDINPAWGPGNRIVFESNRDGNWELYMVDVSTDGQAVRLTDDLAFDINAFWAPDGETVYFQSDRGGNWDIYALNVDTGDLTQITDSALNDAEPILSHDGTTMAWLQQNEFGVYNLWLMDLATGETRQLTDTGTDILSPDFAPDDSFMVYQTNLDGDFDIFAVDIDSGLIKALTVNNSDDGSPTFRCDSSIVVYHSDLDAEADYPGLRELYEVNALPLDGPANTALRLTQDVLYDDIFPLSDPREEIDSRDTVIP